MEDLALAAILFCSPSQGVPVTAPVDAYHVAFNAQDRHGMLATLSETAALRSMEATRVAEAGAEEGVTNILDNISGFSPPLRVEIAERWVIGTLVIERHRYRHPDLNMEFLTVFRVEDGCITAIDAYS